ncbi:activator protein [Nocardia sp. SYP-A9097]|uniref:AfsR/SARP family transcriptional regulator n=1 Tax=Nocardia sp. SYP-A9097 TaxID=2663237 RepID=UPI0013229F2B|nr:AfsR/SARP family transcriptional regulator [Nocardia sp. SYP-A9097]MRH92333.1 activator protein [Nocardia sp. SYP-A9097]
MRYELLGPIQVIRRDDVHFISARKVEILLATLLAKRDQAVHRDQLIIEIWGDEPPRRASAALHVYVSQLRKFLGPEHDVGRQSSGKDMGPIITRPLGYMLRTLNDEIDVSDFEQLVSEGRAGSLRGDLEVAVDRLERALALWRSTSLLDLRAGPILDSYATWLEESRIECLETLIAAYLNMNKHREVVGRLYVLAGEYPMRENFLRYLMLALFRSDRRADALSVYREGRERLKNELGLEPCRSLQEMNYAILTGEESLLDMAC